MQVGIWSVGVHLPEQIRENDWWSDDVVSRWREKADAKLDRAADADHELATDGARLVLKHMSRYRDDVFRGARQRRILADAQSTTDIELLAARKALASAEVAPGEVDLLLSSTTLPDVLLVPNACRLHERLGLPARCFSLQTEGVCNAFLMQLALAEQMIRGGQARVALLVQSSGTSRLVRPEDPLSAWFGDAATAVVVGKVADGYGLLGRRHETYGEYYDGLKCGRPDGRWYDGAPVSYIDQASNSRSMLLSTMHRSRQVIHDALAEAGTSPEQVDFYASHQGFAWFRAMTQEHAGLVNARTVDTFEWTTSVLGCNIPLVLHVGEKEGLLRPGDLVASFAGAAGAVISAFAYRWGRG